MLHGNVIRAVFRRDFTAYFSNALGYVFISAFVLGAAFLLFFRDNAFFAANLANLAPLNKLMPVLLLAFIPTISMNVWAEEKKQGTDALLLTLPAKDLDIVLGKYFAALAIYSVALTFSLANVLIIWFLGAPDAGLTFATYAGYWLMGAALLAFGMVGSLISGNATIGFIAGLGITLTLVYLPGLAMAVFNFLAGLTGSKELPPATFDPIDMGSQFEVIGKGTIRGGGLVYFLSLIVVGIYFNAVLLGRRHWRSGRDGQSLWLHHLVRGVALLVAVGALNVLVLDRTIRVDVTSERLHTLHPTTFEVLEGLPQDRPIVITAYISPEVPKEYIEKREDLRSKLEELAAHSGAKLRIQIKDTELYSSEAREARELYNIQPQKVQSRETGKSEVKSVFMGIAAICGTEQDVIPFLELGLPAEYELVRSIRKVSQAKRRKIGFYEGEIGVVGQFDVRTRQPRVEWQIVKELRKQYDVVRVEPDKDILGDIDVLVSLMPSSLSQEHMDKLEQYMLQGKPCLLLDDVFPTMRSDLAPHMASRGRRPGMEPENDHGNFAGLLAKLRLELDVHSFVWNDYNPHADIGGEGKHTVLFIGGENPAFPLFNPDSPATADLQEVVFILSGALRELPKAQGPTVMPLLRTGSVSGLVNWDQCFRQDFFSGMVPVTPRYTSINGGQILAAHVEGNLPPPPAPAPKNGEPAPPPAPAQQVNAIVIADLDIIGDQFFEIRQRGIEDLDFDNVTFILNCIDELAGDRAFIELRKRRKKLRTLTRIEDQMRGFLTQLEKEQTKAERTAEQALAAAQSEMDNKIAEIEKRTDLDPIQKAQLVDQNRRVLQRRFNVRKEEIEADKERSSQEATETLGEKLRAIEGTYKIMAIALPPIPALLIGLVVFIVRRGRERESVSRRRLL